jgi:hypothetical protein
MVDRTMARDRRGVKSIFDEAAEIASPEGRAAYLERACGGDADLRKKVDALLMALDEAGSFLEATSALDAGNITDEAVEHLGPEGDPAQRPALPQGTAVTSIGPDPGRDETMEGAGHHPAQGPTVGVHPASVQGSPFGSVIAGRYKLREEIGEGGMGTVYLAEQTHPVKRKVALKLIREGMGSNGVLARFESERQALALMDHPNIAKVFDAGTTEFGRPFFVMELVKGVPLPRHPKRRSSTTQPGSSGRASSRCCSRSIQRINGLQSPRRPRPNYLMRVLTRKWHPSPMRRAARCSSFAIGLFQFSVPLLLTGQKRETRSRKVVPDRVRIDHD